MTSGWNGDNDGDGCSLGLAGIDGDGLGVRKGPGGDKIPFIFSIKKEQMKLIRKKQEIIIEESQLKMFKFFGSAFDESKHKKMYNSKTFDVKSGQYSSRQHLNSKRREKYKKSKK